MHIFEAPKDRFEIVTNARDAYTDYFLEEKISVSAIAERESWVRYVYDMGDDWRHKLTFEKEWKTMTKLCTFMESEREQFYRGFRRYLGWRTNDGI